MTSNPSPTQAPQPLFTRKWLLFLGLLAFFAWGGRPLWDSSEARYAQAAVEMVNSGNWLMPRLGGHEHLTKPVFTYWMIGIGYKLLGFNEWGARLMLSVAFFGTMITIAALARAMGFSVLATRLAALVYGSAALPWGAGHVLTTDGFLVFWTTLGICSYWKLRTSPAESSARWRWLFWIAFGMAFFTKGPPGWLYLVVIAIYEAVRKPSRLHNTRLFGILPFLVFLVISFWWYVAVVLQDHSRLGYFLGNEIRDRVLTNTHGRESHWWIFLVFLPLGMFPWIFCAKGFVTRALAARGGAGILQLADWVFFTLLWISFPFVVFTLAKSRLVLYIAPLMPAMSLLVARVLETDWLPNWRQSASIRKTALILANIYLAILATGTVLPKLGEQTKTENIFGRALAEATSEFPASTQYFFILGNARYSAAFYSGKVIRELQEKNEDLIKFDNALAEKNIKAVYLIRGKRIKSLPFEDALVTPFLKGDDLYAIEFNRDTETYRRVAAGELVEKKHKDEG